MVNTLAKGDVWVGFKYNGLPPLYCIICRRLGHARHNCEYPLVAPREEKLPMIGFHGDEQLPGNSDQATFSQNHPVVMEGLGVWPHEITSSADPSELGQSSQAQQVIVTQITTENPQPQPPTAENTTATPRRRGRPLGSTNKATKPSKSDKGKAPIVQESCDVGTKKRKLSEPSEPDAYIPKPFYANQTENPSSLSINFIHQLLQHPETVALLARDGIINPSILNLIQETNETPKSPTSIFQGPYAPESDDERNEEEHNTEQTLIWNGFEMVYTDLNGNLVTIDSSGELITPGGMVTVNPSGGLLTVDPSGGFESRNTSQNNDLNEGNNTYLPGSSLLYTPPSELHSE
ncbi:hypothetical protein FRX31_024752, partial [Thalictrum thalictroides]